MKRAHRPVGVADEVLKDGHEPELLRIEPSHRRSRVRDDTHPVPLGEASLILDEDGVARHRLLASRDILDR